MGSALSPLSLQLALDDLLAELRHARRSGDLGRLALIAWCEVRPWARRAGETELAERVSEIVVHSPHASRSAFLHDIDGLIDMLALVLQHRSQGLGDCRQVQGPEDPPAADPPVPETGQRRR